MSNTECMNDADGKCDGAIEYRYALSGTGKSYPRCDFHWDEALDRADAINDRYPTHAPSDFDPAYAGEVWYEEES